MNAPYGNLEANNGRTDCSNIFRPNSKIPPIVWTSSTIPKQLRSRKKWFREPTRLAETLESVNQNKIKFVW